MASPDIPRGRYRGERVGKPVTDEAEHFIRCPACGAGSTAMTKKKPRYESRVFDGRIIHSAEIERIHKEVLDFERIEAISEPMRELIEDLWPELVSKLPPKAN